MFGFFVHKVSRSRMFVGLIYDLKAASQGLSVMTISPYAVD